MPGPRTQACVEEALSWGAQARGPWLSTHPGTGPPWAAGSLPAAAVPSASPTRLAGGRPSEAWRPQRTLHLQGVAVVARQPPGQRGADIKPARARDGGHRGRVLRRCKAGGAAGAGGPRGWTEVGRSGRGRGGGSLGPERGAALSPPRTLPLQAWHVASCDSVELNTQFPRVWAAGTGGLRPSPPAWSCASLPWLSGAALGLAPTGAASLRGAANSHVQKVS